MPENLPEVEHSNLLMFLDNIAAGTIFDSSFT